MNKARPISFKRAANRIGAVYLKKVLMGMRHLTYQEVVSFANEVVEKGCTSPYQINSMAIEKGLYCVDNYKYDKGH